MCKRLSPIGAFCIGLMALWSTDANAWPASSSGWYVTHGSIIVNSTWVGIANTDLKPTLLQVTIIPHTLTVNYQNPGGNTGGAGVPFDLPLDITGVDTLFPTALSGRGKYTSSVTFDDQDLLNRINQLYPGILEENAPNPQWTPYSVEVTSLDVYIQAFADVSLICPNADITNTDQIPYNDTCFVPYDPAGNPTPAGPEEEVVHIKGFCTLNGTEYNCTEDVDWEWSKRNQSYPYAW